MLKFHIEVSRTSRYCYLTAISDNTKEHIGKICIDLDSEDSNRYKSIKNKTAKIILIWTNESVCRQGIATALMNKTIELFKDYLLYLNVIPIRSSVKDKDKNGLIEFYSKFGFKKYNKDICVTTMIRK